MLGVAIEYKESINKMTSDRSLGLWKFELSEREWGLVGELYKQLKVSDNLRIP